MIIIMILMTQSLLYLDFQDTTEGHAEISIEVLAEDSLEGLLEQGRVEGVSHNNVPPENKLLQIVQNHI